MLVVVPFKQAITERKGPERGSARLAWSSRMIRRLGSVTRGDLSGSAARCGQPVRRSHPEGPVREGTTNESGLVRRLEHGSRDVHAGADRKDQPADATIDAPLQSRAAGRRRDRGAEHLAMLHRCAN